MIQKKYLPNRESFDGKVDWAEDFSFSDRCSIPRKLRISIFKI